MVSAAINASHCPAASMVPVTYLSSASAGRDGTASSVQNVSKASIIYFYRVILKHVFVIVKCFNLKKFRIKSAIS